MGTGGRSINERQVEYSNLPPRKYVFRVIACNNSGVWNEAGDTLNSRSLRRTIRQPGSARCAWPLFLGLLWALYRYRLHQITQNFNAQLEARLGERTRIARDLHDTLLQSFQAALFEFQAARNLFLKVAKGRSKPWTAPSSQAKGRLSRVVMRSMICARQGARKPIWKACSRPRGRISRVLRFRMVNVRRSK